MHVIYCSHVTGGGGVAYGDGIWGMVAQTNGLRLQPSTSVLPPESLGEPPQSEGSPSAALESSALLYCLILASFLCTEEN